MNVTYKGDIVGADHAIRQEFRSFLMMRYPYELEGSDLYRLEAGEDVPAVRVRAALDVLLNTGWSVDVVYKYGPADTQRFIDYTERQVKIEKTLVQLRKAIKLSLEAEMDPVQFDRHVGRILDELRP